jgi:ubiquinol-cytochrome c reductase cytochrome c1 subunit
MTIRLVGIIIGLAITGVLVLWSLLPGAINFAMPEKSAYYAFHEENIQPAGGWSFDGPLGKWDNAQLQRGYQVYKEVCAACHSMKYVDFRNLEDLGYSDSEVRAEAASWTTIPGLDPVTGEATTRPGEPTDAFPSPYPNEIAARSANNNALPPDLSLITKARSDGTKYIYSLMLGYNEPDPEDLKKAKEYAGGEEWETPSGLYFNEHFYSVNIAMPPQLQDGLVTYADGTEATKENMAADIAAFLTWTAEPKMVQRKQTGSFVIGFLLFATALAFLSYKQIWAGKKPKKKKA